MSEDTINVYGADWCPKTTLLKNYLQAEWIDFTYHNVETNEEAREVLMELYEGKVKFPTVTQSGRYIKNPSVGDLRKFLEEK